MIRIDGIRKTLGGREILGGIELAIPRGELFCLVGPSGCGKSTLLRCIASLAFPDAGTIDVNGTKLVAGVALDVDALARFRRKVGFVFQELHLFPHLTALENVALAPRRVLGECDEASRAQAREFLARVGLAGFESRHPANLSGGQRQRVAIARALAMRPDVLLYDEPTSALDPTLVGEVVSLLRAFKKEGLTQLVVTHEMRFAREASDRVGHLEAGKLVAIGAPEEVLAGAFGAAAK